MAPMSDDNQILIPQSFMALFVDPGRGQPRVSRELLSSRYDLCEDMACLLAEPAQTMVFDQGVSEAQVWLRCHQGLLGEASLFSESEAGWVISRLAELLGWPPPATPG
jgi:hypothetical protein